MSIVTKNKGRAVIVNAVTYIDTGANTFSARDSVVSVFPESPADATPLQTLRLTEQSGTLDFWLDEEEDVYSLADGEPI